MLNKYKTLTNAMCTEKGWNHQSIQTVWLLLTEEVGELASAIRQHEAVFKKVGLKKNKGVDVRSEMGDVFSYLFQLAYMLDIDLDAMWREHQHKLRSKKY